MKILANRRLTTEDNVYPKLQEVFVWPSENQKPRASGHEKNKKKRGKEKSKAPGALDPAVVLLPLREENILRSFKIRAKVL